MWISFTDLAQCRVWVSTAALQAVLIPSPLSPGDGKCRVFAGPILCEVSRTVANEILAEVQQDDQELVS